VGSARTPSMATSASEVKRLAALSVSHLYNLRKTGGYRAQRTHFTKTPVGCSPIGVRKAPGPDPHLLGADIQREF